jgi:hypothetical protein
MVYAVQETRTELNSLVDPMLHADRKPGRASPNLHTRPKPHPFNPTAALAIQVVTCYGLAAAGTQILQGKSSDAEHAKEVPGTLVMDEFDQ